MRSTTSRIALTLIAMVAAFAAATPPALAQDERPSLRDRIRQMRQIEENYPEPPEGPARIDKAGTYTYRLEHGGLKRKYLVHVPARYRASTPAPMVLALHGGGGFAEYQAKDENYGLISKSDQAGFIAVFPNGYSPFRNGKFATWNAGTCCAGARDKNIDDLGFLRAVVDDVARHLDIDRARVYSIGMSNGALMSYRLACEAPDLIHGVMAVAGTDNTVNCEPRKPVSILHVHAKNDDHVKFEGGAGPGTKDESKVTNFRSVSQTIEKWVKLNRCNPKPARVLDTPGATCDLYDGCAEGTRVKLCVTERGAHSWPGGVKTRGSEPTSKAIVANDVMWEFFTDGR
jgi:polyhydroxybutyrate depolymerase